MAKVLVLGSGGREHALCYRLHKSPSVQKVFCAPGSYGMSEVATIVALDMFNHEEVIQFCLQQEIDLVLVGPETVLDSGIVDSLKEKNINVFGPSQKATQLESSKVFSKDFMKRYHIPTASYEVFNNAEEAKVYLRSQSYPIVIKANGLAAGKGVVIPRNQEEAFDYIEELMVDKKFGDSGNEIVVEEFMDGEEFSLLVLCHNQTALPLQVAQDYKRINDNDQGENTGGMGSYTPVDHIFQSDVDEAMRKIVYPTLQGMIDDENPFTGVLFCGLMKTKEGIKTIEYNVRFGDPETESLMLAFESDLYEIIQSVLNETPKEIEWSKKYHLGVVLSAPGYPQAAKLGYKIQGLAQNKHVFHMGTKYEEGNYFTNGGRVAFVYGEGNSLEEASKDAYQNLEDIETEGIHYRKDIGVR